MWLTGSLQRPEPERESVLTNTDSPYQAVRLDPTQGDSGHEQADADDQSRRDHGNDPECGMGGGGGGYGDPNKRDRKLLDDEVKNGFISAEAAQKQYGLQPKKVQRA